MNRVFVETQVFKRLIDAETEDVRDLEKMIKDEILKNPEKGDLIQGTGGLRKIRIGGFGRGKSGGYRVIYLDLEKEKTTYLFLIYAKNVSDNLSAEQKKKLKMLVEEIKNEHKK